MKQIADSQAISIHLTSLAEKLLADCPDASRMIIIGIQRRGAQLGQRLAGILSTATGREIPIGILDITFYRDDLSMVDQQPIVRSTEIPINLDNTYVVLVDDVIYTGRTARAALNALVDFGRAQAVRLLVLVDRGWRELPIQPDYIGWKLNTTRKQVVQVKVTELDGEDGVFLENLKADGVVEAL